MVQTNPIRRPPEAEPLVSVVLPVYNGEPYLEEAMYSIVRQTYKNLEIIVIDDGSIDSSMSTLRRFARSDSRIVLRSREYRGLVETLNEGLGLARGEFVARMDADDVSMPHRIEKQVAYLAANPKVLVLGVKQFQRYRGRHLHAMLTGTRRCTWALLFQNYIGHPGVMFRAGTARSHGLAYEGEFKHVEDYRLWCQFSRFGWADVLNEPLLFYRRHPAAVSLTYGNEQLRNDRRVSSLHIMEKLGVDLSDLEQASLQEWMRGLSARLFSSSGFASLAREDREAIHVMFQEYSSRYGFSAAEYIANAGVGPVLKGPWGGLRYLYRTTRALVFDTRPPAVRQGGP